MMSLDRLKELQAELNDYCDPNDKVKAMVQRFIDLELQLQAQAETFRANLSYEIEQRAAERTKHE
tara:strand:- start:2312 stop:2506 length:195 start_codon:yes stop_codon:yes gene_type:complete